jgi:hypothetical protein
MAEGKGTPKGQQNTQQNTQQDGPHEGPQQENPHEDQQSYQEKLEAQLAEWEAIINEYMRKAETATAEAKLKYQEQIDSLREQHAETLQRLHALQNISGEAWEDLRAGMESAWHELKQAFEKAAKKFKDAKD